MTDATDFQRHDAVITPRGDKALVLRVWGDFLDLRYLHALPGAEVEFTLHRRLVTKCVSGHRLPPPVRVARL